VLLFATFAEGVGAAGTYDVTFEDGSTEQGSFNGAWCVHPALCG
jgi:hypothetical protein